VTTFFCEKASRGPLKRFITNLEPEPCLENPKFEHKFRPAESTGVSNVFLKLAVSCGISTENLV